MEAITYFYELVQPGSRNKKSAEKILQTKSFKKLSFSAETFLNEILILGLISTKCKSFSSDFRRDG